MPETTKKESKPPKNLTLDEDILGLLKDNIKFQIVLRLLINTELSMTELSNLIKRAKATVHRHLKTLINFGVVKVSKQEKVRGSIKAKYYKIADSFYSHFEPEIGTFPLDLMNFNKDQIDLQQKVILLQIYLEFFKKTIKRVDDYLPDIGKIYESNTELYAQELKNSLDSLNVIFLTKKQRDNITTKLDELYSSIIKIKSENQDRDISHKKPYFLGTALLKLDNLFD
ncbi:MAG: transcriptional regulator [Promethearchaeota archaeon]|nr:MAG: transcriptional regulator [Candidatus Lokiarchaeota archaeon]